MGEINGGQEKIDLQTSYLERIGCTFDTDIREELPDVLIEVAGEYFQAQDEWRETCISAAGAEEAYCQLMGETSYTEREEEVLSSILNRGRRKTLSTSERYGRTLAARQAVEERDQLVKQARKTAEDIKALESLGDLEKAVWSTILESNHPANLDPLPYIGEAMQLLSEIDTGRRPVTVIRRRVGNDARDIYLQDEERIGFSDVVCADRFNLEAGDGAVSLVAEDAVVYRFEELRTVSYGGRSGLIGSANFEDVWVAIDADKINPDQAERLAASTLVGKDQLAATPEDSFVTLRQLARGDSESFWESLRLEGYHSPSSSGRGDNPSVGRNMVMAVAGDEARGVLESRPASKKDRYTTNWGKALSLVVGKIERDKLSQQTAAATTATKGFRYTS